MDSENLTIDTSLRRARAAVRMNDPLAAVAAARRALTVDPCHASAHALLGIAQFHVGNCAAAEASLARATELDPRDATAHLNYAVVLDHIGKIDEAMQELQAALLLRPDYGQALELHSKVSKRLRDRRNHADGGFAVVDNPEDPFTSPPTEWAKIQCASCSTMNFITARTCCRCGSLLPEADEVSPVE